MFPFYSLFGVEIETWKMDCKWNNFGYPIDLHHK